MNKRYMKQRISSMDKEGTIIMVVLTIFLIFVLMLSFLFVRMMDERNDIRMNMTAEQIFTNFFIQIRMDSDQVDMFVEEDKIRGLGTYNRAGELIVGFGEIPDTFLPDAADDPNLYRRGATYNPETGMIEYVRKILLNISIGENQLPSPEYMYLALDGKAYRVVKYLIFGVFTVFCLAMIVLIVFIWRMYARNRMYRETIARQKSLVNLGEAARTLAHEIKNPLSAIALQTAVMKKQLPADALKGLATIDEQVMRLNKLADRVREFIKNARGNPEKIEIIPFLQEIADTFGTGIKVQSLNNRFRYVVMDPDRARSVFENLIRNGLESGSGEGVDSEDSGYAGAEVRISCRSVKSNVIITIADNGNGLPTGQEKQIYDPFFTTKAQGSGIGLSITRRFIESAGGTLRHVARESMDGDLQAARGTVAEVTLPGKER